jgi:hypothetical protein
VRVRDDLAGSGVCGGLIYIALSSLGALPKPRKLLLKNGLPSP